MTKIYKIRNVRDYYESVGAQQRHPLVAMVDYSTLASMPMYKKEYSVYGVFLKDDNQGTLERRHKYLDYTEGTMMFVSPGQCAGVLEEGIIYEPKGYALVFDRKLIEGSWLEKHIIDYPFFSYDVNEALRLEESDRETMLTLFGLISRELDQERDSCTKAVLVGLVELVLNHCQRLYHRQFVGRKVENRHLIISRLNRLLGDYFESSLPQQEGFPTVAYCADQLNLSPNYLGHFVKRETGHTAIEHIHQFVVTLAQDMMKDKGKSISQIAEQLGMQYPHHLSRLFKKVTGKSPKEFRSKIS